MMNIIRQTVCSNLIRNSARNFHPKIFSSILLNHKTIPNHGNINNNFSTAALDNSSKGIFQKMFGKFANSKSRLRSSSVLLYETVADCLIYRDFFDEFDMPDTFNSWFLVTELHCWMLMTRVMGEGSESGEDGRFLRNCIVESMWTDVQTRAKKLSLDNPSASRAQVQILSEQFQATLINYDEGMSSDDKYLANALWRRFFDMKCEDFTQLEKLVKYVRKSTKMLDSLNRDDLLQKPKIEWPKLND